MLGNRPSVLPVAQFCPMSAILAEQHGAGRAAAVSTVFHATASGAPHAKALFAALTPAEQTDLATWQKPTDVIIGDGIVLDYELADKELGVGLDSMGYYCDPNSGEALTAGTLDFAWVTPVPSSNTVFCKGCMPLAGTDGEDGPTTVCEGHVQMSKVAYVGDIKKSLWTSEGPESLQLQAYALAYAQLRECDGYVAGLWIPTEGEWLWSEEIVWLGSPEAEKILARVLAAAANRGTEASFGGHCTSCYGRLHCKEWSQPLETAESYITGLSIGQMPRPDEAATQILRLQALMETAKRAKENAEEWVRRGFLEVVDAGTGKVWREVMASGKVSVDTDRVKAERPDLVKKGAPYSMGFRWLKGPKK